MFCILRCKNVGLLMYISLQALFPFANFKYFPQTLVCIFRNHSPIVCRIFSIAFFAVLKNTKLLTSLVSFQFISILLYFLCCLAFIMYFLQYCIRTFSAKHSLIACIGFFFSPKFSFTLFNLYCRCVQFYFCPLMLNYI